MEMGIKRKRSKFIYLLSFIEFVKMDKLPENINDLLLNSDSRLKALNTLKHYLQTSSQENAENCVKTVNLRTIFDCLNDKKSVQIKLTTEVLSIILKLLTPGESLQKYASCIKRCLRHVYPQVKIMAMNDLKLYLTNDEELFKILVKNEEVLYELMQNCLGDSYQTVAKTALQILQEFSSFPNGLDFLQKPASLLMLNECLKSPNFEPQQFAVYLAANCEEVFNLLTNSGVFESIFEDVTSGNATLVKLISPLCVTEHGYEYLEKKNFFSNVFGRITKMQNQTQMFFVSEICKLFANLVNWRPEILNKHKETVEFLFNYSKSNKLYLFTIFANSLQIMAKSDYGKLALDSLDQTLFEAIKNLGLKLMDEKTSKELLKHVLLTLEVLFKPENNEMRFVQICEKWFYQLGEENSMQILLNFCLNLKNKIKCNDDDGKVLMDVLAVFDAVISQSWGQKAVLGAPGFLEFLVDRRMQLADACRLKKYDIVCKLANSVYLSYDQLCLLDEHVKNGPEN